MKKMILSTAILVAMTLTSCKNEKKENPIANSEIEQVTESKDIASTRAYFGVRGNCVMCKATIEKAANAVDGVSEAVWNVHNKNIRVSFDKSKTDLNAIHNAIAASGYDTENASGDETAYSKLPACCQYDHTMEMNQKVVQ